jgi:hypothetical protein
VAPPDVAPPEVVSPDEPDEPDEPDDPAGQLPVDVLEPHAFSASASVYGYALSVELAHLHLPPTQT